MSIALNKRSALSVIRALRANGSPRTMFEKRTDLPLPSHSSRKKWTRSAFGFEALGLGSCLDKATPLDIAVPNAEARVRLVNSTCSVYASGIPPKSFVPVENAESKGASNQTVFSCPELVFIEMATVLSPMELVMLGHELCGTFSRDAADPACGPVTFGVEPVTSAERIAAFIDQVKNVRGKEVARKMVRFVDDNAWSPMESLVAALLRMRADDLGFSFDSLVLNPRVSIQDGEEATKDSTRVPDILVSGTKVGLNYDGMVHLDLAAVARAAAEAATHPESAYPQEILETTMSHVRAKAVDDLRRNRELASAGYTVLPVVKEDLIEPGGIEQLVMRLIAAVESETGQSLEAQRRACSLMALTDERHKLVMSLLPGKHERDIKLARFVGGFKVVDGPQEAIECMVEL
ncbi:MAG: hypothetical protein IJ131_01100 [Eggerthellaceae bacterium]|nr:hypothetical protein [Eggerthellaceae bacterium]